jgi:UDP:flavonoid glycosyltransferase YjiC (YdhE family)
LTGHYRPLLPLARALATAGHDVAIASGEPVVTQAAADGFTAFRAGLGDDARDQFARRHPDLPSLPPSGIRSLFFTELFVRTELEPRANDLTGIVERWRPHLIVHDVAEFAAPLVATAFGIPYVDHGFGPLVQNDVVRAAGEATAPYWSSHGLTPHPLGGLYRHLYLDVCPPSLQSADAGMPNAVQRIRTVETAAPQATPPPWLDALRDLPTVYITFGTIYNRNLDLFRTLLDGLRDEQLQVVVTVGTHMDPAALDPQPPNVHIHRYVPQELILPSCTAVLTHGGAGSMLGALAFGLPLLLLPQGADHFYNAERITAAGAGIRLAPGELSADTTREALRALLRDDSFRNAAGRIRDELEAMPDPGDAVAVLEELAARASTRT